MLAQRPANAHRLGTSYLKQVIEGAVWTEVASRGFRELCGNASDGSRRAREPGESQPQRRHARGRITHRAAMPTAPGRRRTATSWPVRSHEVQGCVCWWFVSTVPRSLSGCSATDPSRVESRTTTMAAQQADKALVSRFSSTEAHLSIERRQISLHFRLVITSPASESQRGAGLARQSTTDPLAQLGRPQHAERLHQRRKGRDVPLVWQRALIVFKRREFVRGNSNALGQL